MQWPLEGLSVLAISEGLSVLGEIFLKETLVCVLGMQVLVWYVV